MIKNEQIVEASKARLEAATAISNTAFNGVEKLVELNMQAVKTSLAEVREAATSASSIRTVEQFVALQKSIAEPAGEKLSSYSRQVAEIVKQTAAEMTKVLEGVFAENRRNVAAAIEAAVQKAPMNGSALDFVKATIASGTTAYENVTKAVKQASEVTETNILAVSNEVTKAARATKTVAAA